MSRGLYCIHEMVARRCVVEMSLEREIRRPAPRARSLRVQRVATDIWLKDTSRRVRITEIEGDRADTLVSPAPQSPLRQTLQLLTHSLRALCHPASRLPTFSRHDLFPPSPAKLEEYKRGAKAEYRVSVIWPSRDTGMARRRGPVCPSAITAYTDAVSDIRILLSHLSLPSPPVPSRPLPSL